MAHHVLVAETHLHHARHVRQDARRLRAEARGRVMVEKLKELIGDYEKEQMKKDMAVQEAVTVLSDNAREV